MFDFCFAGLQWANMPFSPKRYLRFPPKKGKSCGAGGIRTHVQTGKPYAFYTLIPDFNFRAEARPGPPTTTLASKFHTPSEALTHYFRFTCTAWTKNFGTTAFERCLVLSPGDGIKPVTYCTSVRQRERSYFRQLNS